MTNRLFIAFDLDNRIKNYIDEKRRELFPENKERWIEKKNLHATIKFLGDTNAELIESINSSLIKIAAKYSAFECSLRGFGFFERPAGGILYVDFIPDESFFSLIKDVEESMSLLGFAKEKKEPKPHITILRYKTKIQDSIKKRLLSFVADSIIFSFDAFSLMKSDLKPTGSVYTEIKKFELKKI